MQDAVDGSEQSLGSKKQQECGLLEELPVVVVVVVVEADSVHSRLQPEEAEADSIRCGNRQLKRCRWMQFRLDEA